MMKEIHEQPDAIRDTIHPRITDGEIHLEGGEIMRLFEMTPYYYKTSAEGQARAAALRTLTTETSFEILLYRKK